MAEHGLVISGSGLGALIDSTYKNFEFISSGSVYIPAIVPTWVEIPLSTSPPLIAFQLDAIPTTFISYTRNASGHFDGFTVRRLSAGHLGYRVYFPSTGASGDTHGLRVFNAGGEVVYDSGKDYMRFIGRSSIGAAPAGGYYVSGLFGGKKDVFYRYISDSSFAYEADYITVYRCRREFVLTPVERCEFEPVRVERQSCNYVNVCKPVTQCGYKTVCGYVWDYRLGGSTYQCNSVYSCDTKNVCNYERQCRTYTATEYQYQCKTVNEYVHKEVCGWESELVYVPVSYTVVNNVYKTLIDGVCLLNGVIALQEYEISHSETYYTTYRNAGHVSIGSSYIGGYSISYGGAFAFSQIGFKTTGVSVSKNSHSDGLTFVN
jgi:hypothetical protein